jgi:hypothetical protein
MRKFGALILAAGIALTAGAAATTTSTPAQAQAANAQFGVWFGSPFYEPYRYPRYYGRYYEPRRYRDYSPRYHRGPRGGWAAHVRWCHDRYRSYQESRDAFKGYDGRWHKCNSPYG